MAFHSTQNSGNFGWYIKWKGPFRFGLTELLGTSFEGGPLWPFGRWYWNVPFLTKLSSPVPLFCILLTRTITKRAVAFSAIMVITKDLKKIRITLVNAPFLFFYLQESHESQRRACLRCCISLSYHWSANSDLILWLWDYFHKRMVGIFSCSSKYSLRRFWFTTMKWKPLLTHFLTPVSAPLYPSTLFSLQSLALIDRAHILRSACGGIRKRQQRRFWATHVNRKCSLRSRRLKVVGTIKNRRARRRHAREEGARRVSPSRAPVLSFTRYFQAPVTQATGSEDFSLLPCLDSTKFILLSVFTVCSKIWAKILPQNASLCLNLIMISTVPLMQCDIFLWPRQVSHNPVCLGIHSPLCCQ